MDLAREIAAWLWEGAITVYGEMSEWERGWMLALALVLLAWVMIRFERSLGEPPGGPK